MVSNTLKNISQLGLLFPIYGKHKNVPNHKPGINGLWLAENHMTSRNTSSSTIKSWTPCFIASSRRSIFDGKPWKPSLLLYKLQVNHLQRVIWTYSKNSHLNIFDHIWTYSNHSRHSHLNLLEGTWWQRTTSLKRVADKITYSQWTWPKWVVPYRLWRFVLPCCMSWNWGIGNWVLRYPLWRF